MTAEAPLVNARVNPSAGMEVLSRSEIAALLDATQDNSLAQTFRRCALAVLTTGAHSDDAKTTLNRYQDFEIKVLQQDRGIKLELRNAPPQAFVDGEIVRGTRELLYAVLRDVVYFGHELERNPRFDLHRSEGITNCVFEILRHAGLLEAAREPSLVVCWGGHSISRNEYSYTKQVGYELGLRHLDIVTGCGPGAMKGPMKGATIAHSKQRREANRYIGITEPGIIAAESPNPIVNHLVIMPDIEKRLEAFVRLAHGIVIFPGGVGTAEEILYLIGILLHPDNVQMPFPLVMTGPESAQRYFSDIDAFLVAALGPQVRKRYEILVNQPERVAQVIKRGIDQVREYRIAMKDAFFFNWLLKISPEFQAPFEPSHEAMAALDLAPGAAPHVRAANLRRAFSGIVAGNVKESGIAAIARHGPFEIRADRELMGHLDGLLHSFVEQQRMKLPGGESYQPCYRLVSV